MKILQACFSWKVSFAMLSVLGLDIVTSESLFGYESTNKDTLAVVAGPADISGERIVLPDTSQFLQSSIQVSGNRSISQFPQTSVQVSGSKTLSSFSSLLLW
jgi:hypothetical protein